MKGLSLRAYARHRKEAGLPGGSLASVQDAIAAGRLRKSITKDRRISSAAAADAEWAATTKADRVPLTGPAATGAAPEYAESRARREAAEAALAEIELDEKRGELVRAREVDARLVGEYARAKTKILAVPSKARQRDPAFTAEQLALLGALLREVLDDLASDEDPPARAAAGAAS